MGISSKASIVAAVFAYSSMGCVYAQSPIQNTPSAQAVIQQNSMSAVDSLTEERNKLIEEVKQEFPSPYVGDVIYDSEHTKYIEYRINQLHDELELENRWKGIFRENYPIREKHNKSLEDFLQAISTNEGYKQSIRRMDIEAHYLMFLHERAYALALTPFTDQFVRTEEDEIEKSTIFLFPLAFKDQMTPQEYESIEFPLRSKLDVIYAHELVHAKQNIHGFDLGDGTILGKYEFVDMLNEVKVNVMEGEAYYETYQHFKNGNDPYAEFLSLDKLLRFYGGEIYPSTGVKIGGGEKYAELVASYHEKGIYSDTEANAIATLTNIFLGQKEEMYTAYHRLGKELSHPKS